MSDFKEEILSKVGISLNDIIIVYPDNIKSKEEGFGIYTYDIFTADIICELPLRERRELPRNSELMFRY